MIICENCEKEHDGSYGSGRFCSSKCARGFSTKAKRKEINEKLSKKLKKKYFYLYKITNKINGKYYIGVHETKNLDDGYMGSGKVLHEDYKKYGIENFEKEILEYFHSSKEMYQKEYEVVNEEFLELEETYNLICGGEGGWSHVHKDPFRSEKISNGQKKSYENPNRKSLKGRIYISNLETKQIKYIEKDELEYYLNSGWILGGKVHKDVSDEEIIEAINTTLSMAEAARKLEIDIGHLKSKAISLDVYKPNKGRKGSIRNKCWIYNLKLKSNKFIKKEELNIFLNKGWILGRKNISTFS